jgi:hypothetical protein
MPSVPQASLWIGLSAPIGAAAALGVQHWVAPSRWQMIVSDNPPASVWRLDTATGHLELCTHANGVPACFPMPAPKDSN